jgi:hypothetical protein
MNRIATHFDDEERFGEASKAIFDALKAEMKERLVLVAKFYDKRLAQMERTYSDMLMETHQSYMTQLSVMHEAYQKSLEVFAETLKSLPSPQVHIEQPSKRTKKTIVYDHHSGRPAEILEEHI